MIATTYDNTTAGTAMQRITAKLTRKNSGYLCPAHDDHDPSLSVKHATSYPGAVIKCHAGCDYETILESIGLTKADLYDNPPARNPHTERVRILRARSDAYPYEMRADKRRTVIKVANRLLDISAFTGTWTFDYQTGAREIAEAIGTREKAAWNAQHTLQDLGWITLGGRKKNPRHTQNVTIHAQNWGVRKETQTTHEYNPLPLSSLRNTCVSFDSPLGVTLKDTGVIVLGMLSGDPRSVLWLHKATGITRKCITGRLAVLERLRLAQHLPSGWIRGPRDLIAEPYDPDTESMTGDPVAKRRAGWARQRAGQDEFLIRSGHSVRCPDCGHVNAKDEICQCARQAPAVKPRYYESDNPTGYLTACDTCHFTQINYYPGDTCDCGGTLIEGWL